MLLFNISYILKARDIKHHTKFFEKIGLSRSTASAYKTGRTAAISLNNLELICEALNCTPNDLLEFIPSPKQQEMPNHPLDPLNRQHKTQNLMKLLNALPFNKLQQAEELLKTL